MPPVRNLFRRLTRSFKKVAAPSRTPDLNALLNGYRGTALLYVAAKLKVPDMLAPGPIGPEELAQKLNLHEQSTHRLLRALAALGICVETNIGQFALSEMGHRLRSDTNGPEYSLAILNGEEYMGAWNHLAHSIRTGETAFDHAFGETVWAHREARPELNELFNRWLRRGANATAHALLDAHPFSTAAIVADIGGGDGSLITGILKKHLNVRGILFDQPHVLERSTPILEAAGVQSRCELVPGNFFAQVPKGANVYILKSILHDWDDRRCSAILHQCKASMKPGNKLLVVEKLLPERAVEAPAVIMSDLHMLAVTGGMERTRSEYEALLAAAGFSLQRVQELPTGHSLLESIRV